MLDDHAVAIAVHIDLPWQGTDYHTAAPLIHLDDTSRVAASSSAGTNISNLAVMWASGHSTHNPPTRTRHRLPKQGCIVLDMVAHVPRLRQSSHLAQSLEVSVAVLHMLHMPAKGLIASSHILGEGDLGVAVNADLVVIIEGNQLAQGPSGQPGSRPRLRYPPSCSHLPRCSSCTASTRKCTSVMAACNAELRQQTFLPANYL